MKTIKAKESENAELNKLKQIIRVLSTSIGKKLYDVTVTHHCSENNGSYHCLK